MDLMSSVYSIVVVALTTVLVLVLGLFFVAPSQFDPYTTDQYDKTRTGPPKTKVSYGVDHRPVESQQRLEPFKTSVQIVVLGDIGRSPRMQYHALSLADRGAFVHVVGYGDTEIHPSLRRHADIKISILPVIPSFLQTSNRAMFMGLGPLKVVFQTVALFLYLGYAGRPTKWTLVQNPPSIPVLAIARIVSYMRASKLVIDWHNFGWSVLALKLKPSHPLVTLSQIYELRLARTADRHIAVTQAMADSMDMQIGIKAVVLHDRPATDFQPLSQEQRESTIKRIDATRSNAEELLNGRMRLLVSSTSWTADEDFGLLLEALTLYSSKAASDSTLPQVLLVITGKGPQKEYYLRQIRALESEKRLTRVKIETAWLTFPDYASLLGAADLGVSLHKSTSGLDFPMKVLDMFGTGLPVVGWSEYKSWPEVVREGISGRGFSSANGLMGLLVELFSSPSSLTKLREGALTESQLRWEDKWDATVGDKIFFPTRAKLR